MAGAFFNRFARGKARAMSAGTAAAETIQPAGVEAMREVGVDLHDSGPKALTLEMLEQAHKVVTMGCSIDNVCPAASVETDDWGLEDPKDKPMEKIRDIRDEIKVRVTAMLKELEIQTGDRS